MLSFWEDINRILEYVQWWPSWILNQPKKLYRIIQETFHSQVYLQIERKWQWKHRWYWTKSDDKSSHGPMISKNIFFIHVHVCPMLNYVNLIIIINNKNTKTKTQKTNKSKWLWNWFSAYNAYKWIWNCFFNLMLHMLNWKNTKIFHFSIVSIFQPLT